MITYPVSSLKNLRVRIYVVGYHKQGESIVIILLDNATGEIFYCGVIDTFKKKNIHVTKEILEHYGIKRLNTLCWSHPDNDHSWGLDELLENYCDDYTDFIYPYGVEPNNMFFSDYNRYQYRYLQIIHDKIAKKQVDSNPISVKKKQDNTLYSFDLSDSLDTINVAFRALSPFASFIHNKHCNNQALEKNDFSVVIVLQVGAYRFLFTSDITDRNIPNLKTDEFDNPLLIKIPHHGSSGSLTMLDPLNTSKHNTLAATTVFAGQKDPKPETIRKYKQKCCRIDSTHTHDKKIFGIIRYDFDLYDTKSVRIKHVENACQL